MFDMKKVKETNFTFSFLRQRIVSTASYSGKSQLTLKYHNFIHTKIQKNNFYEVI